MVKNISIIVITIILLYTAQLNAQFLSNKTDVLNPFAYRNSSLLNSNKLTISHSIGFESGYSSNKDGYYLSRYTNHINYKFNSKWDMAVDLNFLNYGTANNKDKFEINKDNKSAILPEFSLKYRPSDHTTFEFHFKQNIGTSDFISQNRNWWE